MYSIKTNQNKSLKMFLLADKTHTAPTTTKKKNESKQVLKNVSFG